MKRFGIVLIFFTSLFAFSEGAHAAIIAHWSFDNDFTADIGGSAFDLNAVNGALAGASGGRFGNAASFSRASSQYAVTSGNVLQANADFSYSAWFNFGVPDITGGSRYFVLETSAANGVSNTQAWTASLGLRESGGDIAQFFTSPSIAFATSPYGSGWNNAIVTYDADGGTSSGGRMQAFVNGNLVGTYDNVASTTAVEGLVIGGHRSGTGRNFEGLIDDVAFFDTALTSTEIASLQTSSAGAVVPEPGTLLAFSLGGLTLLVRRRRRPRVANPGE